jgi:DNA repair exonuclease SbcCD ATPase subunit
MIKSIELWNFECHEHSKVTDLTQGLNLVFGESDSGKTSIVRALKLVAYNEFNPKSVRVGSKHCEVRVTTERGYVHVKRGKGVNEWEVGLNGESPRFFEKIGKTVLPEVTEVLGLSMVELGDMKLPVNIMDQAESHFMLSQLGGEESSGSMRAQIVDEISGLSGIEVLIKGVSLDRHRYGRKVKEHEDAANDFREKMHDTAELDVEEELLNEAESCLSLACSCTEKMDDLAVVYESHSESSEAISTLKDEVSLIPNTRRIQAILKQTGNDLAKLFVAKQVHEEWCSSRSELQKVKEETNGLPDVVGARDALDTAKSQFSDASMVMSILEEIEDSIEALETAEKGVRECGDVSEVKKAVEDAEKLLGRARRVRLINNKLASVAVEVSAVDVAIKTAGEEYLSAVEEINNAMKKVTVCPLTEMPVSKSCLEKVK